jgi:hypothetical protein
MIGATPREFIRLPKELSFWGNNIYGDCVTAEEAFAKACHDPEIFIRDTEVIEWATTNGVLNGAVISDVLALMVTDGFEQRYRAYDDGPAHTVDWSNPDLLCNAIYHGPVKLGIAADQLNSVYTYGVSGWFATGFYPDSAEDHCVSLCGYGSIEWLARQLRVAVPSAIDGHKPGYAMFTWDTVGIIDEPSMVNITQEAWLRRPTTKIEP